jgi:apolipoprotein N-acyltransferase
VRSPLPIRPAALACHAITTLLAFPHELPGLGAFDFGLVFAWLGPAALVVALDGLPARAAARSAFLASLVAHVLLFHWFIVVTVTYGGMPFGLGVLAPLLPGYWVAQFGALFAVLWVRIAPLPGAAIGGACAWVAVDWLRGVFLGGFPWATLGYALHRDDALLAFTRAGGVYALSFLAAGFGIALGRSVLAHRRGESVSRRLVALAGLFGLVHAVGLSLAPADPGEGERVRIAAIQGNIDQREKWSAERRERILETYLRLSDAAAADGAEWIVWPETALPGSLEWDAGLRLRVGELARRHHAVLVVGGMGIEFADGQDSPRAYYDSAFLVDPEGSIHDRYDKTQLVPFGEFVPLRGLLGRFFQSLARGLSPDDVTAGVAPRALELPGAASAAQASGGGETIRVGVPICYELIFPDLVRRFAADRAGVLLAVTNDAWYGRTGAPHQFLAMTAIRSAETGLFTVRAANTGVSAVIDGRGRVLERSALFEEAVVVADVPVQRDAGDGRDDRTFYARYGDVFAGSCILLALAALLVGRRGPASGPGRIDSSIEADIQEGSEEGRGRA